MPQKTVATSGVQLLPRNPFRKSLVFIHIGTANVVYFDNMAPGTITTSNAGLRTSAGGAIALSVLEDGPEQVQDEWSAIGDAGSQTILVYETVDKKAILGRI